VGVVEGMNLRLQALVEQAEAALAVETQPGRPEQ
jgi:hypothetical protein